MIGDSILPSQFQCFHLKFLPFEQQQYDVWEKQISRNLICRLKDGRFVWNMARYRELVLITTWLWFRFVHDSVKAGQAKKLVAQIHSKKLPKKWVKSGMEMENKLLEKKIAYAKSINEPLLDAEEGFFDIPPKATDLSDAETLQYLLKGSPKLHHLLPNIQDEVLVHGEKSIV